MSVHSKVFKQKSYRRVLLNHTRGPSSILYHKAANQMPHQKPHRQGVKVTTHPTATRPPTISHSQTCCLWVF